MPIWEGYDEPSHYAYVQYVASHWSIPPAAQGPIGLVYETKQPPLYYFIVAASTFWLQPADLPQFHLNPYRDGKNRFVHGDDEGFPYPALARGVHAARFITVLLSAVSVWGTFATAVLIFPGRPWLVLSATAIHAFWPQFLFMSSIVNNDAVASAAGSLIILCSLRLCFASVTRRDVFWLGMTLITGALIKLNVLTLAPLAVVCALIALASRLRAHDRQLRAHILLGTVAASVLVALAGWLYVREMLPRQTDDVPLVHMLQAIGWFISHPLAATNPYAPYWDLSMLPEAAQVSFATAWALFGWGSILVENEVYAALALMCSASLLGALMGLRWLTPTQRLSLGLLAFAFAVVTIATFFFILYVHNPLMLSGRYLLLGISALAVLLAAGFAYLWPGRQQDRAAIMLAIGMGAWAVSIPFHTISPVFARPQTLSAAEIERVPNRMQATFGDELELLGFQTATEGVGPGQSFDITLYWRALKPISKDYEVAIRLVTLDGRTVASVEHFPSQGNYATSVWPLGEIVPDEHRVMITTDIGEPAGGRVVISVFSLEQQTPNFLALPTLTGKSGNRQGAIVW